MSTRTKVILVTLGVAVPAFTLSRMLFPPHPHVPEPIGVQLPLLIALSVAECLLLGGGVAFLAFGRPYIRRLMPEAPGRALAVYLSLGWLMINWYPHIGLHIHHGMEMGPLVAIDYAFHLPLYVTPIVLIWAALGFIRDTPPAVGSVTLPDQLVSR